ncbi:MAG: CoA-binding protein [Candidatus Peregrinibacteria bacterium]
MKRIAIVGKRTSGAIEKHEKVFRQVYSYLKRKGKIVFVENQVAELLKLKKYQEFVRGKTEVDLILVMGETAPFYPSFSD